MGEMDQVPGPGPRAISPRLSEARLPYHAPLLRVHGTLRDVTAQKSADISDVNLKENIDPVVWS